jgi:feruloyl esterase
LNELLPGRASRKGELIRQTSIFFGPEEQMKIHMSGLLFFVLFLGIVDGVAATCESLTALQLTDTTITLAQSMGAGAFTPPRNGGKSVPVAFCRVTGTIRPTSDSDIRFELWLPQSGWTGRYESVGNGGFAGSIVYGAMLNPLLGGSAVASTDDGHTGGGASWALGHPEKIIDYGYRAVHLTAVAGKAITAAFYGSQPKYSYFVGCSKGGQEALMEAQRFADDFDGILGAANANQWTKLFSSFAWNEQTIQADRSSYLSPSDLDKIGVATKAACDASDGVKDGLIGNPQACRVSSSSLSLSPLQTRTFEALHSGPKDSSGKPVYVGLAYGSENVSWRASITGPSFDDGPSRTSQTMFANGFFSNFVYNDPSWDFRRFDVNKSPADAEKAVGRIINSDSIDLAAFQKHGGKLLQWHGWADSLVTALGTIDYYTRVMAAQETPSRTQDFYRLFMAPGVDHCGGGPGPNQFGQTGGNGDADHDMVVALYQWVEKGVAPSRIVATKYVDNDVSKDVEMTRPLCPYPQTAKYKGSGDSHDAANFVCAAP